MPLYREILLDWQKFFLFLGKRRLVGFNFCLTVVSLLFLPSQGYYPTLQNQWQKPQIVRSRFIITPLVLYPQNITGISASYLSAKGVVVLDPSSSVKLFEKNIHSHFSPASTSKMMTALVALDYFKMDDILTVPKLVDEGQDIKLAEGEKMSFENLLYALLVASANDAAQTLAANSPGGKETFVKQMNEKVAKLFLKNTHFVNPTGIDEPGQYSSPFDLSILTKYALANPAFAKIVQTQKITLTSVDGKMTHEISNINQLLGKIKGVGGVKTGWTEEAGECLVTYVEREGRKIIIVVLGSKDRFGETEKLINWVFENFQWVEPEITS